MTNYDRTQIKRLFLSKYLIERASNPTGCQCFKKKLLAEAGLALWGQHPPNLVMVAIEVTSPEIRRRHSTPTENELSFMEIRLRDEWTIVSIGDRSFIWRLIVGTCPTQLAAETLQWPAFCIECGLGRLIWGGPVLNVKYKIYCLSEKYFPWRWNIS